MADLGHMEVVIGADVQPLVQGVTKAELALKKIPAATNQAANALQNLGRVAQDAPFGFIGIQNNINPLLESFQRLKAETGSAGGAFKALAGSLAGAGGIGLAVSVATAALTLLSSGFFDSKESAESLGNQLEALGVDFDNAKRRTDAFNRSIDTLKGLRDINLKLGLPDEKQRIQVQLGFDKQDAITKLRELRELETASEEKRASTFDLMTSKGSQALGDLIGQYTVLTEVKKHSADLTDNDNKLLDAAIKAEQEKVDIINQQDDLRVNMNKLDAQAKSDLVDLNKKEQERLEKLRKQETIADVLSKLAREIAIAGQEEDLFGIDKSKDKISAIKSAIKRLAVDFKVDPKDTIIQKLFGNIEALKPGLEHVFGKAIHLKTSAEILIDAAQVQKEADAKLGKTPMKIKAQIVADIQGSNMKSAAQLAADEFKRAMLDANEQIAVMMHQTMNDALASIGQGIADSITNGTDLFKTIFGGLFEVIGAGMKQMGKAMIELGTAKIALEKFAFAPGIGTVIAGIAVVALGALLQKAIPAFAMGTENFSGGLAKVGERGTELVNLPKGSGVIPNHKLAGITSGGPQVMIPDVVLRGQDMVLVFNRANRANARAF